MVLVLEIVRMEDVFEDDAGGECRVGYYTTRPGSCIRGFPLAVRCYFAVGVVKRGIGAKVRVRVLGEFAGPENRRVQAVGNR